MTDTVSEVRSVTVGWMIERLEAMAAEHGRDVEVLIHDADTGWALPIDPEYAVRFGKDEYDEGKDGAVMIQSAGYYWNGK